MKKKVFKILDATIMILSNTAKVEIENTKGYY